MQDDHEEYFRVRGIAIFNQLINLVDTPSNCVSFIRPVHSLAGAACSLGFADYGEAALCLEFALEAFTAQPCADTSAVLQTALVEFRQRTEQLVETRLAYNVPHECADALLRGTYFVLVEDSGVLAQSVQRAFLQAGATEVLLCPSLRRARAVLSDHEHVADAVLIDYHVGRRQGTELAAWIRMQPHLAQTRCISYSGVPTTHIQERYGRDLYDAYIQKPIGLPDLIRELHLVLM